MGRSQSFWLGVVVGLALAYIFMSVHVLKMASTPGQVHILSHVGRFDRLINKYGDEDEALAFPDDTFQAEIVAVQASVEERVAKLEKRVRQILRENQRLRQSVGIFQQSMGDMAELAGQILDQKVIFAEMLATQLRNLTNQSATALEEACE